MKHKRLLTLCLTLVMLLSTLPFASAAEGDDWLIPRMRDYAAFTDTAGTICEAVRTLNNAGAKSVTLVATHGLLSGPAVERLRDCGAREIVLTDTVPVPEEKRLPNMTVLSVAPLLAAGIRSVFESGSVSTLLNGLPEDMRPRNIYA